MERILIVSLLVFVAFSTSFADIFGTDSSKFEIEFVPISAETNPSSGFGVVIYDYRISTNEITNEQWNKFIAEYGVVTGSPAGAYDSDPYWTASEVPANKISWYEAAQFVNWLNTSTGHSPAYKFTGTKGTGDYTFEPWNANDTGYDAENPYRNSRAFYFLPTEHEWVKAAYWNGADIQTYTTRDNTLPFEDIESNYILGQDDEPWDVGTGCWELNGTFDMTGNVWEWMELPFDYYLSDSVRCLRGGAFDNSAGITSSFRLASNADAESYNFGFRVASLSELSKVCDLDGDGDCDMSDFAIFAETWLSKSIVKNSIDEDTVSLRILKPGYRNRIYSSYPINEIVFEVYSNFELMEYNCNLNFYADGNLLQSQVLELSQKRQLFTNSLSENANTYKIEITIHAKESGELVKTLFEEVYRQPAKPNEVVIDQNDNLLINGEKFLPIGIFFSGPATDMHYIKDKGFNCIAPYHPPTDEFISVAQILDLKMMPSFIGRDPEDFDKSIKLLINSDSLLGYYLYDEPQPVNVTPQEIKNTVAQYADYDPYHPTFVSYNIAQQYYGNASDVMMVDSYFMPRDHELIFERMNEGVKAMDGHGPVWFIGQIYPHWIYNDYILRDLHQGRVLTYDEIRAYTWMSFLLGAKGIFYYNYHTTLPDVVMRIAYPKMWEGLGYITAELKALEDVILCDNIKELQSSCNEEYFKAQLRQIDDSIYIIVVNGRMEPIQCDVQIGQIPNQLFELGHNHTPVVNDGVLQVNIPAQTAQIYSNNQQIINHFQSEIPVEQYRQQLEQMNEGLEKDIENNVARIDRGSKLFASWQFPELGETTAYGKCRATTWNLMIDGNRATKWRLGDDGRAGLRYVWPDESIYQGQRWLEVKFAQSVLLEEIIVTITPNANYELKYFSGGNWIELNVTNSASTDQYHYKLNADIDGYNAAGVQTDRIRLYFNNLDDSANPPTVFEIEAIENH